MDVIIFSIQVWRAQRLLRTDKTVYQRKLKIFHKYAKHLRVYSPHKQSCMRPIYLNILERLFMLGYTLLEEKLPL